VSASRRHLHRLFDGLEGFVAVGMGFGGRFEGKYTFQDFAEAFWVWPDHEDALLEKVEEHLHTADIYVCPLLRKTRSRKKGTGGLGRFVWADVDGQAPAGWERALLGPSSFVVGSGRGQHPYIALPEPVAPDIIEEINQRLALGLDADSGWSETKYLRLAGTFNHKPRAQGGASAPVTILEIITGDRDWTLEELRELLPARSGGSSPVNGDDQVIEPRMPEHVPEHLEERLEEEPGEHPGAQSFKFVLACIDAGLDDQGVMALAFEHRPTREKFGSTDPAKDRRAVEIKRSIRKVRPAGDALGTHPENRPRLRPATSSRLRPESTSSLVPFPSGGDEVEDFVPDLVPSTPHGAHSWLPLNLVARRANPPAPPEIVGLFYPGYNHLVSGESEALKTWLALAAAADELRAGRGVLWVDADDVGEGALLERLRLLGVDDDAIARRFAYVLPDEPLDEARRDDVLEVVRARACRLAVLDGFNPLLVLQGLNPDSGTDVETFYRLIDPIRKAPTAVYLSDNVVKAREARGAWAIGSERKKSKAEVHLGMRTLVPLIRGGTGRAKIEVHKDRPGHLQRPSPGVLVIETGGERCTWEIRPDESRDAEGDFRPTALMEKVSRYLELQSDATSRNQIEAMKLGKAEYVRVAIDRLVVEGFATEFDGPRRARLVRLERRFREDEDAQE
jgi:hypothetical protein